jgi:hypothetical protein
VHRGALFIPKGFSETEKDPCKGVLKGLAAAHANRAAAHENRAAAHAHRAAAQAQFSMQKVSSK